MSGKTPGQAAYEGMVAQSESEAWPIPVTAPAGWDELEPWQHARWEAAAAAAAHEQLDEIHAERDGLTDRIAGLVSELNGVRAELETSRDDFLFERKQVIALRQVLTEVFTCLDAKDAALLDDDQVTEWRERSGVEAAS